MCWRALTGEIGSFRGYVPPIEAQKRSHLSSACILVCPFRRYVPPIEAENHSQFLPQILLRRTGDLCLQAFVRQNWDVQKPSTCRGTKALGSRHSCACSLVCPFRCYVPPIEAENNSQFLPQISSRGCVLCPGLVVSQMKTMTLLPELSPLHGTSQALMCRHMKQGLGPCRSPACEPGRCQRSSRPECRTDGNDFGPQLSLWLDFVQISSNLLSHETGHSRDHTLRALEHC